MCVLKFAFAALFFCVYFANYNKYCLLFGCNERYSLLTLLFYIYISFLFFFCCFSAAAATAAAAAAIACLCAARSPLAFYFSRRPFFIHKQNECGVSDRDTLTNDRDGDSKTARVLRERERQRELWAQSS